MKTYSSDESVGEPGRFVDVNDLPRWIPVTERLPDYERSVLVTDGTTVLVGFRRPESGRPHYFPHGPVFDPSGMSGDEYDWEFDWYAKSKITHWMPLPDPPTKE